MEIDPKTSVVIVIHKAAIVIATIAKIAAVAGILLMMGRTIIIKMGLTLEMETDGKMMTIRPGRIKAMVEFQLLPPRQPGVSQ